MVSCLMGDSTALASAIVRCCLYLNGLISEENFQKANVAIAKKYDVLEHYI